MSDIYAKPQFIRESVGKLKHITQLSLDVLEKVLQIS